MNIWLRDPDDDGDHSLCMPCDFQMPGSFFNDFARFLADEQGIGWLEGKNAGDCVDRLWSAFQTAAAETPGDRWEFSAGFYLMLLWSHARSHPRGVFSTSY